MLVTLAVLLLMMSLVVKIFQAATGSLSAAQGYQELDNSLRQLDATIRSDLNGVTASMTPPNDPKNNKGYFEYGENEFADLQGEDSDDYIRFTAKAPAGRPFTGRMWVPPLLPNALSLMTLPNQVQNYEATQPITVTSEYAEIIYFLRNGNLYRRVILVSPERQAVIANSISVTGTNNPWIYKDPNTQAVTNLTFAPTGLNSIPVSWQSMNDLSAHPAPRGVPTTNSVILNTLSDLTNRENRFAYQRFADDFTDVAGTPGSGPDGLAEDLNGDNVPDYYPSLYPGVFGAAAPLIFEAAFTGNVPSSRGLMAFPFVYPGAYSRPQFLNNFDAGWIHSPEPIVVDANNNPYQYDLAPLPYLQNLNHNPIQGGDNLPDPSSGGGGLQTWWGFPTWREMLSPFWTDPTWQVNTNQSQPFGLAYQPANVAVGSPVQFLPDMTSNYRNTAQPYNDGLPDNAAPNPNGFFPFTGGGVPPALWSQSWEDDLILTGVRSFDVKAYDNALAGYADLGWGDDLRLYQPYSSLPGAVIPAAAPGLSGTPSLTIWPPVNPAVNPLGQSFNTLAQTFAHEGRMPPLVADMRLDAAYPNPTYNVSNGTFTAQYPAFPAYSSNIGDNNASVVRLRRVWDSWSTEYSNAPATGVNPSTSANALFPAGPPYSPPIFPSYPPPYPAPLRAIQIQIRVTDPTNQRIKTLTIRQDFTDKL